MVNQKITDRQQRLENFLESVEAAQQLQDDIMKYGLNAAYLYCDDVDGDWLETWGDDEDEPTYIELLTTFLESDDAVAVKVREKLQNKSVSEIIEGLEYCLSQLTEIERIFAAKDLLVGGVAVVGSNRGSRDEGIDEIEMLDLAEELLNKLREILG
ncbi:hypothetical protein H6G54_24430 [Anabaena cylindrica FACHB-243]|uniref:Uncharacterized protein n=1 Tax=Anabaena cylindrica (strain ATCC 27899 / PCC 7122) TaxID=272123 RepID=K9ZHB7_ANACC|nr:MULTISPECIES: hypothetical protein [Anabaena]AFZ57962.1 hypothetical protein Anacy_2517 [Anabaena cylindrica PCC 7122]MBD2420790.1 hypothetical protein [Anabaena cylindrica FACHB-243]MBY5282695.1 hypothetical protein [Anabaena sp. CCAP 1446/1C]MBY5307131.1 hypothetical protein [Anabaena sp. CCAP 1446/1C]MCM2408190.1 hypothetical protein [Anabaena sp. CCAP 1446/1C]